MPQPTGPPISHHAEAAESGGFGGGISGETAEAPRQESTPEPVMEPAPEPVMEPAPEPVSAPEAQEESDPGASFGSGL